MIFNLGQQVFFEYSIFVQLWYVTDTWLIILSSVSRTEVDIEWMYEHSIL